MQDCIILGAAKIILQNPEEVGLSTLDAIVDKGRGVSASCFVGLMECYAKAGIELPDEVTRYPGREKDFYSVYAEIDVNCIGLLSVLAGNDNHQVLDEILPEHMLELGAFLNISRFHHLSLEDLLHLETTDKDIDRSKFLYQIAKASGLEPDKLRQQAASLKGSAREKRLYWFQPLAGFLLSMQTCLQKGSISIQTISMI